MEISLAGHCVMYTCNPKGRTAPPRLTTQNVCGVLWSPGVLQVPPTSLFPTPERKNHDPSQGRCPSPKGWAGGIALARKTRGPQGHIFTSFAARGWKCWERLGRGQSDGLSTGKPEWPRSPHRGPVGQGWVCQGKEVTAHALGYRLGGPVSNWNLGYWPYLFFTSTSTNGNDR